MNIHGAHLAGRLAGPDFVAELQEFLEAIDNAGTNASVARIYVQAWLNGYAPAPTSRIHPVTLTLEED